MQILVYFSASPSSKSNLTIIWADIVVDAAKYLTTFGYDVLTYILLTSLSNDFKRRLKDDGTSIALWLSSLASFCGKVFRKYSALDPTTIVQYTLNQLRSGNIYDLIVFKELLAEMGGINLATSLSDAQLHRLAGGPLLRNEALSLINPDRFTLSIRKSSGRLLKSLTDHKMIIPLLLCIAQQRQMCIFEVKEDDAYLKLLGNLFDDVCPF